ncbi:fasciclin domain-containing protein [Phenylobacterium sp.]|uniref:fasciclin domain-containing protein n=1 Tax=Phenylobacterium sp. TaxID=1871053 RepID=UPI003565100F
MKIDRLLTAAAAVSLIAGAALAQTPAAQTPAPAAAPAAAGAPSGKLVPNGTLATTLRASGQFNTFVKALDAVNLATLLQNSPGLTVFAPTDAAFPQSKLDAMVGDKTALQKTLLHYIINAKVDSTKIKGARGPLPTGAGDIIVLDGSADVLKADNANIIQADVMASNGIIHVIDALLVPGSVPATLPEPPAAEAAPAPAAPAAPPPKAPARKKK